MEFAMPIRVRWDVDFRGRVGRAKRIARSIREIAPLVVEARFEGEKAVSELSAVFTEIHKCGAKIEATVGLLPRAAAASRMGFPVDFIWSIGAGGPFAERLPEGARTLSFAPDEETIAALPGVVEEFARSRAAELRLPNVNAVRAVADRGHVPIPAAEQIGDAAREIAAARIDLGGRKLAVHDFFLWRALRGIFPAAMGDRVEVAGCQAGTALVHVDWEGNVYPCDSLPIRLGNLLETPFEAIWRSPARERIIAAIHSVPATCEICGAIAGCFGGCRGLAYLSADSFDAPDPSCPGPSANCPKRGKSPSG